MKTQQKWRLGTSRAMTFVELLVTLALTVLVVSTVIVTLAGGFRVWERLQGAGRQGQWMQVAVDQFHRDLHNVSRFQPIPFEGRYDACSFPTLVFTDQANGDPVVELGAVSYFLDSATHVLCRSRIPYRRLRQAGDRPACAPVLQEVTRLRFSYYVAESEGTAHRWVEHWSSPEPPLAVKMQISYDDASTARSAVQTLVVALPLANWMVSTP